MVVVLYLCCVLMPVDFVNFVVMFGMFILLRAGLVVFCVFKCLCFVVLFWA